MSERLCPQCNQPNRDNARFCKFCGAPMPTSAPPSGGQASGLPRLQVGDTLQGRYRIDGILGKGGFGAVYYAWDTNVNRLCALKENLEASPDAQRQFAREASVLANLSHPNLPRVTDHFSIPGQGQYLVMDFVKGDDLRTLMERQETLDIHQVIEWIIQVANALSYMHSRQPPVVHRDIKPANIRITPEGQAFLVDFGLVKFFDPQMKTTMGARAVTPGYAPPEQYGQGITDPRTDVYALGATLYCVLTGQEPIESVQRALGVKLPPAHQVNPKIPVEVGEVIERAMALVPNERYQAASEFKEALLAAVAPVSAPTLTVHPKPEVEVSATPAAAAQTIPQTAVEKPLVVPAPKAKARRWTPIAFVLLGVVLCLGISAIIYYFYSSSGGLSTLQTDKTAVAQTVAAQVNITRTAQAKLLGGSTVPPTLTNTPQGQATQVAQVTATSTTTMPPRPMRILFTSNGPGASTSSGNLYILEPDGTVTELYTEKSDDFGRGLSPDGRQLAFNSNRAGSWQIYILDLVTRSIRQITFVPDQARHPAWSPDGAYIAFTTLPASEESEIFVIGPDGKGLKRLVSVGVNGRPTWSPDSTRLVFNSARKDSNWDGKINSQDVLDLFVISIGGDEETNLTNSPHFWDFAGVWSPDGQWIVFGSIREDTDGDGKVTLNDNSDLYKIHPDGTGEVRLTNTPESAEGDPFWSRDGGQILYVVMGKNANALWVMNADGTGSQVLLQNYGFILFPAQIP